MEPLVRPTKHHPVAIALLIALAVLLTGCMHIDRGVTLNSDGSGSYTLTIGFSQQVMSAANAPITTSMNAFGEQVAQQGGSTRHYDDSGYSYWAYTRPFKSIADLNTLVQQTPQSSDVSDTTSKLLAVAQDSLSFSEQSGILGNSFHVTGHMSMRPQSPTSGGVPPALKDMRESLSITMPGAISSHKGGVVHGNTVTYVIHYGEETDIDAVGGGFDTTPLLIGIGGAVIALLIIAALILWLRRRGAAERRRAAQRQENPPAFAPVYTPPITPPFTSAGPDAPTVPAMDDASGGAGQGGSLGRNLGGSQG
jgi:hypothetical protein